MSPLLPFRKYGTDGALAIRDGLVFVLLIDKPHTEIAEASTSLLNRYLELFGHHVTLIHDRGEEDRPFNARRLAALRKRFDGMGRLGQGVKFTMRDGVESMVPDYRFQYRGRSDQPRTPNEVSY